jgi:hypothetical protein
MRNISSQQKLFTLKDFPKVSDQTNLGNISLMRVVMHLLGAKFSDKETSNTKNRSNIFIHYTYMVT